MSKIAKHDVDRLISRAVAVRDQAYAPHSHFYVGAAILVSSGEIVAGCNVENASYGLSICAERAAACAAVSASFHSWSAIAVASVGGVTPVSYTHLTLPTINGECSSRWSADD